MTPCPIFSLLSLALFVIGSLVSKSVHAASVNETEITSPDGSIRFHLTSNDHLGYDVSLKGKPVIEPSRLVFTLDGTELTTNVALGEIKTYRLNETYPWRGVFRGGK